MRSKITKGAEYWQDKIKYHAQKIAYAQEQLARMGISVDTPQYPRTGDDVMLCGDAALTNAVRVGVRLGRTYNMGDYESMRMDISYDAPCDPARIDAMRDALVAKVRADLDAWRDQIVAR